MRDPAVQASVIRAAFDRGGRLGELYASPTASAPLPILPTWRAPFRGPLPLTSDAPFELRDAEVVKLPFNRAVIAERTSTGSRLWDGPIVFVPQSKLEEGHALPLEVCNYFAYVTLAERIARESSRSAAPKTMLEGDFASFSRAIESATNPIVVAAAATCVFFNGEDYEIAVQERSESVVNGQGQIGVVPTFGLEPNATRDERSRFGLLPFNFLREFVEEFFGREEVVRSGDEPEAPHPDWVFENDLARRLIAEVEGGRAHLHLQGAAIDLTDASLVVAMTVVFTSVEFLRELKLQARGSWEASRSSGSRIDFLSIEGTHLTDLMAGERFVPTSHFSVDAARQFVREHVRVESAG